MHDPEGQFATKIGKKATVFDLQVNTDLSAIEIVPCLEGVQDSPLTAVATCHALEPHCAVLRGTRRTHDVQVVLEVEVPETDEQVGTITALAWGDVPAPVDLRAPRPVGGGGADAAREQRGEGRREQS